VVPAERTGRYRTESEPVLEDGPGVVPLEELIDGLQVSAERIAAALRSLEPGDLEADVDEGGAVRPLGHVLFGRYFHDTYHTGQTELLRQVAGVGDKVI
jgi:hypothetical protein